MQPAVRRVILRNSGACWSRVSFTSSHLYALPQHVVSPRMLPDVGNGSQRPHRTGLMQDLVSELRRITLPRTPVNKGAIEKDRSFWRLRSFRLRAFNRSEG